MGTDKTWGQRDTASDPHEVGEGTRDKTKLTRRGAKDEPNQAGRTQGDTSPNIGEASETGAWCAGRPEIWSTVRGLKSRVGKEVP